MTPGEQAILKEISEVRKSFEQGFVETRATIVKLHDRVDKTDMAVSKVKEIALLNKTKVGTFIAGMVFVFTGIGTVISHYVKSKL